MINVGQGGRENTLKNRVAVIGEGNHRTHAIRELVKAGKLDLDHPIPVTLTYYGLSVNDPGAWIPYSLYKVGR